MMYSRGLAFGLSLFILGSLMGCLKTRSQLKRPGMGKMGTNARGKFMASPMDQQQRAQIDSRFFEIDRDFRELYGKIELLEQRLNELKAQRSSGQDPVSETQVKGLEARIATLEEALVALDKKVSGMGPKKRRRSKTAEGPIKKQKIRGPFSRGEQLFGAGKFVEAISSYDSYRKKYPRGQRYAKATFKMGLAFQKLKKPEDAKAFYEEVIQGYPETKLSAQAQANLSQL